jgi:hypothetical protein
VKTLNPTRNNIVGSFVHVAQSRGTIYKTAVTLFEDAGGVCDQHEKESKCSASVHTEVVSTAEGVTKISLRKSV